MVAIIDYGIGNLASVKNILDRVGAHAVIAQDKSQIGEASHLIIPGVGSFDSCMRAFSNSDLQEPIMEKVFSEKIPVLGICVGAQMMTDSSEEGSEKGLGWIAGKTIKFRTAENPGIKLPHMGWEDVVVNEHCSLMLGFKEMPRFYFAHSYHFSLENEQEVIGKADYGYSFPCAFAAENIFGVQFHPEKSHRFGMKLLSNFCSL